MGRFSRQVKLPEVGPAGQAKIEAAEVAVVTGYAGWVERRYLEAAGVGRVVAGERAPTERRFDRLDPAAREFALGAHAAVIALKNVLSG